MKLTLAETKLLKESVSIISELVSEVRFDVTKNALELVAMDPANVAMVIYKLFSSAFVEYSVKGKESLCINLNEFKQVLRRVKSADTLTLSTDDNKLLITLKSTSKREFALPLIDLEAREQKVPDLNFSASVTTTGEIFADAIEDVDIIGESVMLATDKKSFFISSSSDLSKANVEVPADNNTKIEADEKVSAKYSIEYLKKMVAGSKLTDEVTVRFSKDYPLQLEYVLVDKMVLKFILAPRVDND
ncbi:proliferating cell nuclear antigen (pcna) [Candidatus Woesearchaeota archaeon]|nr:proliferating cell nuclear antigen (pcna) [Candidatus Woesearchaeota archaeon]